MHSFPAMGHPAGRKAGCRVTKLLLHIHRGVQRAKAWMIEYAYLVTLGAVIAVIAASAMYTQRLHAR